MKTGHAISHLIHHIRERFFCRTACYIYALITLVFGATGCSSSPSSQAYEDYLRLAPAGTFDPPTTDDRLGGFVTLFSSLDTEHITQELDNVYAEKLYFNDTFHVITDRPSLKLYMLSLAENSETTVRFLDSVSKGNDAWLRWHMRIRFKLWWKDLDIQSVGITHLRFDQQGKIILHQDYWDSTEGFYAHLPIIGSPIRAIRSQLGPDS
ncbi:hypothetical protein [Hahella ganghwensis]|uniref:hypothetical protein n=1 Tax=Hahella ganghwensis TaxID=286420 RepID=UPI000382465B|nr:hypothetical protein [Hahella ganghwensis]